MAIQPGYRLLMSLDSTTSSFASDLTADPQWLFALYALCVTIRYIYIYIFSYSSYYSKTIFLEKVFFRIISRTIFVLTVRTIGIEPSNLFNVKLIAHDVCE